jgi:hypothetical protein
MYRLLHSEATLGDNIKHSIIQPSILPIDWTEEIDSLEDSTFDYILLTDCVFSMDLVIPLTNCILRHANSKTTLICCHEIRDEMTNQAFIESISTYFKIKQISKAKLHPDYRNDFVEVFYGKLLRKK